MCLNIKFQINDFLNSFLVIISSTMYAYNLRNACSCYFKLFKLFFIILLMPSSFYSKEVKHTCDPLKFLEIDPCEDSQKTRKFFAFLDQSYEDFYVCFLLVKTPAMQSCLISLYLNLKTDIPRSLARTSSDIAVLKASEFENSYLKWRRTIHYIEEILRKIVFIVKTVEELPVPERTLDRYTINYLFHARVRFETVAIFEKLKGTFDKDNFDTIFNPKDWENTTKITVKWNITKPLRTKNIVIAVCIFYASFLVIIVILISRSVAKLDL